MAGKKSKITMAHVVNRNLILLESQEAELKKMLDMVKEAKKTFRKDAAVAAKMPGRKRGRPRGRKTGTTKRTRTTASRKGARTARGKKTAAVRPGSRLAGIFSALKRYKGKAGSGDVIRTMFESQSKVKNYNLFRQRIYPVLTRAYKSGALVLRNGKIQMPS